MKIVKIATLILGAISLQASAYTSDWHDYHLQMFPLGQRIDLPQGSYFTNGAKNCSFGFGEGDGILTCDDARGNQMRLVVVRYKSSYSPYYQTCNSDIYYKKDGTYGYPELKCDSYTEYSK